MSKPINSTFDASEINPQRYQAGEFVEVDDWQNLLRNQNFLWSRAGARCVGPVFNPPFARTNTGYGQTQDSGPNAAYGLQTWYGALQVQRRVINTKYELQFIGYGRNIDVRVNVVRFNSDGTTTSLTNFIASTSNAIDYEWFDNTLSYNEADLYSGGDDQSDLATIGVFIEAKNQGDGTAELFQFVILEPIGIEARLPDV